jgi:tRNA dimethylallyltransferase
MTEQASLDKDALRKPWVIALVGPTATGKTALSLELANRFNGEIIACDSRTVYCHMDIGTAKPSAEEQRGVPHHLIDVANPDEVYTVAQYQVDAGEALADIQSRGRLPVVCGGTGFYARALLEGLKIPQVPPQENLRNELSEAAAQNGVESLRKVLRELDPVSADRIGLNDKFRLIRAIEVSTVLNKPFSEAAEIVETPFKVLWIGLTPNDREVLKTRIRARIALQEEAGLIDEVRTIYMQYGPTQTLMNAIAYKEYVKYIRGEISAKEAYEEAVQNTSTLAKRQLTWFRANKQIEWIDIDNKDAREIFREALQKISEKTNL